MIIAIITACAVVLLVTNWIAFESFWIGLLMTALMLAVSFLIAGVSTLV